MTTPEGEPGSAPQGGLKESSPTLTDCTFTGNSAYADGGGMRNSDSSPTLTNCTFTGNSAYADGGGMRNSDSSPTLADCTFTGNLAYGGGGMYNRGASAPTLTNCTFAGNSATEFGGGMYNRGASAPTLINCILWGDTPDEITGDPAVITYSDIQGDLYPSTGNINEDPLFVDAAAGDLRLQITSPAIDAGDNDAPDLAGVALDLGGHPRFADTLSVTDSGHGDPPLVDMGAYEAPPDVILVDQDALGTNDGQSWENALTDMQDALAWAVSGVEIWVAEGTYRPTWRFDTSDPRSATFQMVNGVAIYGGFDPSVGDEAWEERDWEAHKTTLSGDLNGDDEPGFVDNDGNSIHVFYHPDGTNLDDTAILDGFTITGGNAELAWPHNCGGGMFNYQSSTALTNCTFTGNLAYGGGGMHNYQSSPALTNCTFYGNLATEGGGMYNYVLSSPTLTGCTFEGNTANYGGGMYNSLSSPALANCTFSSNEATDKGGGIYNSGSLPLLTNCILWGDTAGELPDEIYNDSSTPDVTYSDVQGEGIYPGTGNINEDPLFLDPASGDLHLGPDSPCVDAGNNAAVSSLLHDFEGDPRIMDGDRDGTATVDMGVDEVFGYRVHLPLVLKGY